MIALLNKKDEQNWDSSTYYSQVTLYTFYFEFYKLLFDCYSILRNLFSFDAVPFVSEWPFCFIAFAVESPMPFWTSADILKYNTLQVKQSFKNGMAG